MEESHYVNVVSLRDLVPFVQFKKREKHLWRNVPFSKVAAFSLQLYLKKHSSLGVFSRFLSCTNGTKSCKASQIILYYSCYKSLERP